MSLSWRAKQLAFNAVGYAPSSEQREAHRSPERFKAVAGGERAGKTTWAGMEAFAVGLQPGGRVALAGEKYDQAEPEATVVIEALRKLGAIAGLVTPTKGAWEITTKLGAKIETVSLRYGAKELTGTGHPYDLVICCEAGLIRKDPWLGARGRVAETRGDVYFVGTLWSDVGWYAEKWVEWKEPNLTGGRSFSVPSWSNLAIYPGGRQDPEIEKLEAEMDIWNFARRVGAILLPSPARIFPEYGEEHQQFFEWDRDAPVIAAIDPGYMPSRYAVLACQLYIDRHGRDAIDIIDEIWVNNKIHQEIINIIAERPWYKNVYRIIAGHESGQHAMASESMEETYKRLTHKKFVLSRSHSDWDRIARIKTFLRDPHNPDLSPRLRVHPRCEGLIYEFQHWERPTDDQGKVIKDYPLDKDNDALDALGNLLLVEYGPARRPARPLAKAGGWWIPSRG